MCLILILSRHQLHFTLILLRLGFRRYICLYLHQEFLQKMEIQTENFFGSLISTRLQLHHGLKLRKYFKGQVGPYQINFGSPHNLLGCTERACHLACEVPYGRGSGVSQGPRKLWDKWCKILHSGHFLGAKLAIQKL